MLVWWFWSKFSILWFILRNLQYPRENFPYRIYNKNKFKLYDYSKDGLCYIKIYQTDPFSFWTYVRELQDNCNKTLLKSKKQFDSMKETIGNSKSYIDYIAINQTTEGRRSWIWINKDYKIIKTK